MRRLLISDTDWALTGVYMDGIWNAAAPIANIIDHRPQLIAQAYDASLGSTQFRVDLGAPRSIGLIYFANLITTVNGIIQVKVATDAGITTVVYNSGQVSTRPQDASGSYSEAEFLALGRTRVFVPPTPVTGQYIQVVVDDSAASPPLQIGTFCACSVYQASLNFGYGWSMTSIDESSVQHVPYGSTYMIRRGKRNRFNFGWPALPENEAFTQLMRLVRVKGKSTPLIVSLFPDDVSPAVGVERSSIYGLFSTDSPISNPFFARYAATLQIDQLI